MGCEVLYLSQSALAGQVSSAIAKAGSFINRGAKKRTDLFFLNSTAMPAILLEVCFVDSTADAELYGEAIRFDLQSAIADVLGGVEQSKRPSRRRKRRGRRCRNRQLRVDIVVNGDCVVTVNGVSVP